jgi:hypothetical protein
MTRISLTITILVAMVVMAAVPAMAADPVVSKKVLTEADGTSVVIISISAKDRAIYGITVKDASGSIEDIVAPNGWAALSAGDVASFRTVDTPIASGKSLAFRVVTTNKDADFGITFRDAKSSFGNKSI